MRVENAQLLIYISFALCLLFMVDRSLKYRLAVCILKIYTSIMFVLYDLWISFYFVLAFIELYRIKIECKRRLRRLQAANEVFGEYFKD